MAVGTRSIRSTSDITCLLPAIAGDRGPPTPSCAGLTRASTSLCGVRKSWMTGSSPAMANVCVVSSPRRDRHSGMPQRLLAGFGPRVPQNDDVRKPMRDEPARIGATVSAWTSITTPATALSRPATHASRTGGCSWGVKTTGILRLPGRSVRRGCRNARTSPGFPSSRRAQEAGFRPCLRCRLLEAAPDPRRPGAATSKRRSHARCR